MALKEQITVTSGSVNERNFDQYDILRHSETPEMHIELLQRQNEPPLGVGESAFGPMAPAIANAVFAATGRRVRRLPIRYEDIVSESQA